GRAAGRRAVGHLPHGRLQRPEPQRVSRPPQTFHGIPAPDLHDGGYAVVRNRRVPAVGENLKNGNSDRGGRGGQEEKSCWFQDLASASSASSVVGPGPKPKA